MGCRVGYSGVAVRVEVCPPCEDPHPRLGYPRYSGYWMVHAMLVHASDRISLLRVSDVQSSHVPRQPGLLAPSSCPHPSCRSRFPPSLSTDRDLSPSSQRHVAHRTPIFMAEDTRITHIASADVKAQEYRHSTSHPSHTAPR